MSIADNDIARLKNVPLQYRNQKEEEAENDCGTEDDPLSTTPLYGNSAGAAKSCGETGCPVLQENAEKEQNTYDDFEDCEELTHGFSLRWKGSFINNYLKNERVIGDRLLACLPAGRAWG